MELNADHNAGLSALLFFHNASLKYPSYDRKTTDELLAAWGGRGMIYAEGIGLAINSTGMSTQQVQAAMESLAKTAQGRIPKDQNDFFNALNGQLSNISYVDLIKTVASETASQIATGAQAVGDSVITSFSWLTKILPFLAVGGALLFVLNYTGGAKTIAAAAKSAVKKRGRKKKVEAK